MYVCMYVCMYVYDLYTFSASWWASISNFPWPHEPNIERTCSWMATQ